MAEVQTANNGLVRANKVTAYFSGDNVITGTFYRTHEKIGTVASNDERVAGFKVPDGEGVTPQAKLEAFKAYLTTNASVFGFIYDPVDRRSDAAKFPSKYDEATFASTATSVVNAALAAIIESLSKANEDKKIAVTVDSYDGVTIKEKYKNESIKYASTAFNVTFNVDGKTAQGKIPVDIVSGQLKKPRTMGDNVLSITGVKKFLIEKELLPKPEVKEEATAEDGAIADTAAPAAQ